MFEVFKDFKCSNPKNYVDLTWIAPVMVTVFMTVIACIL